MSTILSPVCSTAGCTAPARWETWRDTSTQSRQLCAACFVAKIGKYPLRARRLRG